MPDHYSSAASLRPPDADTSKPWPIYQVKMSNRVGDEHGTILVEATSSHDATQAAIARFLKEHGNEPAHIEVTMIERARFWIGRPDA